MTKQDLVVKLLLDSGAFGNDLREAERKAKEFSDSINKAGKTAGDFGKEIGLSAGALGKLSGVLVGGSGVVAAVGAFKSIMDSSYETAKKFNGTIDGFKNVLKEFQQALATMDFTNLNNLFSLWQNGKLSSESMMNAAKSNTLFGWATSGYKKDLAAYKTEYNANGTTPERRAELQTLINDLLKEWGETAEGNYKNLFDSFITSINAEQGLIDLNNTSVDREYAIEILKEVARIITSDPEQKQKDENRWAREKDVITKLQKDKEAGENKAKRLEGLKTFDKSRQKAIDKRESATRELEREVDENRDLMFRMALYNMPVEEIQKILQNLEIANQSLEEYHKQADEVRGWLKLDETKPTTTKSDSPKTKAMEGSRDALKELISENEKLKNSVVFGSEDWLKYHENVKIYTEQLEELEFKQKLFNGEIDNLDLDRAKNTLEELIGKNKEVLSTLGEETTGYIVLTGVTEAYANALDKVIEKKKKLEEEEAKKKAEEAKKKAEDEKKTAQQALIDELGEKMEKYERIGDLISSTNKLFSSFENETLQKIGHITDAFSELSYGIMDFIAVKQAAVAAEGVEAAAKLPYPYNLKAIASVMSTVFSVFASIKQVVAGKFAEGGIVGGTSYSGDKLFAMVNSGEMILNKRQQSNLNNMLTSNGGGQVEFHISGDTLVGVLNNRQRKTNLVR